LDYCDKKIFSWISSYLTIEAEKI